MDEGVGVVATLQSQVCWSGRVSAICGRLEGDFAGGQKAVGLKLRKSGTEPFLGRASDVGTSRNSKRQRVNAALASPANGASTRSTFTYVSNRGRHIIEISY